VSDAPPTQKKPGKVLAGGAAAAAAAVMLLSSQLIAPQEGLRTMPYRDPVGIWTDCYGHTGRDVKPGRRNTLAQCDAKFDADQTKAILAIGACTKVAVPIESFAAFTSFSFNAGPKPYCKYFAPLVNAGRLKAACAHLSVYVYAGHRKLPGLVSRRARERALCEKGLAS
jgi:lysozyme